MIFRQWPWLALAFTAAGAVFAVFSGNFNNRLDTLGAFRAAQDPFVEIDQLINQNDFKGAEEFLEHWLTQQPLDNNLRPRVLWRLSQIRYLLSKNEAGGLETINRLTAEYPQAPETLEAQEFVLSRQAMQPALMEEAAKGYSLMAGRFPEHERAPQWRLSEARLRLKMGNFSEAEAILKLIINSSPSWPELDKVYDELAQTYLALGQPEQAIAILTTLLETRPDSPLKPKARGDLARSLEARGDYRAAQAIYRELMAEHPENPGYKRRLELLKARIKGEGRNADQVDYNYRPPRSVKGEAD